MMRKLPNYSVEAAQAAAVSVPVMVPPQTTTVVFVHRRRCGCVVGTRHGIDGIRLPRERLCRRRRICTRKSMYQHPIMCLRSYTLGLVLQEQAHSRSSRALRLGLDLQSRTPRLALALIFESKCTCTCLGSCQLHSVIGAEFLEQASFLCCTGPLRTRHATSSRVCQGGLCALHYQRSSSQIKKHWNWR